ncbi:MAG: hypothetical protein A3H96_12360 [Acidobacteria bacterium RIFCSPLOWO2_02_FULL_67_36]|nr:MAG: hypothetical protein A3H96_12360 [Acidobacteria bacterium RIFCSPLOWO2_02_FULL_67_36]
MSTSASAPRAAAWTAESTKTMFDEGQEFPHEFADSLEPEAVLQDRYGLDDHVVGRDECGLTRCQVVPCGGRFGVMRVAAIQQGQYRGGVDCSSAHRRLSAAAAKCWSCRVARSLVPDLNAPTILLLLARRIRSPRLIPPCSRKTTSTPSRTRSAIDLPDADASVRNRRACSLVS